MIAYAQQVVESLQWQGEGLMPAVKIRREEMEMVKQAATRVERRSNSRFVIDQNRVEVTEDERQPAIDTDEDDPKSPVVCD